MQFSEAIKAIKDKISLADLARRYCDLKQNGSRFVAPCPFHQETKPSFYVFADKETFYCFGCQASGDLIDFYGRVNGLDFRESVIQLAGEAGIEIDSWQESGDRKEARKKALTKKQAMLAMHEAAASWYAACLERQSGAECRQYVEQRGLDSDVIQHFGLGWAERDWHSLERFLARQGHDLDLACEAGLLGKANSGKPYDRFRGRLIFPIRNLSSQVIAFGGRIIANEDEAKYINSSDTPIYEKKEHLYGLAQARKGITTKGNALLTEGYMDVLTLHQFGFDNSVGVLGTALTEEQINRLSGFTSHIGLLFDGDAAGRKAAFRAAGLFVCRGISCSVIMLPDGEDIDSLLRTMGPAAFERLLRNAPDGMSFCIRTAREFAPKEAIAWAKDFICKVQQPEMKSRYASLIAQRLNLTEDIFRDGLRLQEPKPARCAGVPGKLCERDTQIMIFLVRYPDKLDILRELGADLALSTSNAKNLWHLIEQFGEEASHYLNDKQKIFWLSQRGPQSAPRTNCELELTCLKEYLNRFYTKSQAASLQAALSDGKGDFNSDLEFLHAIRDTMRKNNEQS